MAKRKEEQTLPLNMEQDVEPSNSITYANEVIAIIAGLAASEVEGIAGMVSVNSGLKGKNKNVTRGVKVEVGTEEVSVDLYLNVEYGTPIQRAAHDAQESVKRSIESMTGLHVVRVDVHVMGVSFEKENNALQAGAGKAVLEAGKTAAIESAPEHEPVRIVDEKKEELPEEPASMEEQDTFEQQEAAGQPESEEEQDAPDQPEGDEGEELFTAEETTEKQD